MYDLQLSRLALLIVRRAFAFVMHKFSNFDCKGFDRNSFKACFLFLIADLQSSLNQCFCFVFRLPLVSGIVSLLISIMVVVNDLNLSSDPIRMNE